MGLEDGSIPDESISASSLYFAGNGRLNGEAWDTKYVLLETFVYYLTQISVTKTNKKPANDINIIKLKLN